MSKDHPLHLHFKIILPDHTIYAYKNAGVRVEVTILNDQANTWFMTVRIITLNHLSIVTDTLWKHPSTDSLVIDMAFSHLVRSLNDGITPDKLTQQFFLDGWGCTILDDMPPAMSL